MAQTHMAGRLHTNAVATDVISPCCRDICWERLLFSDETFGGVHDLSKLEREQRAISEGNREGNSISLALLCRIGAGFQPIYTE